MKTSEDNSKKLHKYATVTDDDGENYREIAAIMTAIGFPMNHSSARNYVIRIMSKFVDAFADEYGAVLTADRTQEIAKDPNFQESIADMLRTIELERRKRVAR